MGWATAVVVIAALSFSIPLMKIWTNHRRRIASNRGNDDGRIDALETEVAELRDRVETLERIATDQRSNLDREFDRL